MEWLVNVCAINRNICSFQEITETLSNSLALHAFDDSGIYSIALLGFNLFCLKLYLFLQPNLFIYVTIIYYSFRKRYDTHGHCMRLGQIACNQETTLDGI